MGGGGGGGGGGGCTGVPTIGWGSGGQQGGGGAIVGGVSSGGGVGLQPLRTAVHTISIRLQNCLSRNRAKRL